MCIFGNTAPPVVYVSQGFTKAFLSSSPRSGKRWGLSINRAAGFARAPAALSRPTVDAGGRNNASVARFIFGDGVLIALINRVVWQAWKAKGIRSVVGDVG